MRGDMPRLGLCNETVLAAVPKSHWWTVGMVTDYLRQCGPMLFRDEREHRAFRFSIKRDQYVAVRNALTRLMKAKLIDHVLGADDGREVRVFKLFDE